MATGVKCNACGAVFPVGHSHICKPRECHYLALREGVDQDLLLAYWTDGTLAQMVWSDAKGEYEWEAVRGPDYAAIRDQLTQPEVAD